MGPKPTVPRRSLTAPWAHLLGLPKGKGAAAKVPPGRRGPPRPGQQVTTAVPVTPPPRPPRSDYAAGLQAERKRLGAIFTSPHARQAPELAKHLALQTEMPASAVLAALSDMAAAAAHRSPYARRQAHYAAAAEVARASAETPRDDPQSFAQAMAAARRLVEPTPPERKTP